MFVEVVEFIDRDPGTETEYLFWASKTSNQYRCYPKVGGIVRIVAADDVLPDGRVKAESKFISLLQAAKATAS
jgi:hypothetical protein